MSAGSSFWARRRAAVAAEERAEAEAREAALRADQERELEDRPDTEILAALELPDPDDTDRPEILRRFLTEAVPQRLRNRALRRMWRLNPVLANLDGLVDYGEDYTDAARVPETLNTIYEVGKGIIFKIEKIAEIDKEVAEDAAEPAETFVTDDPADPEPALAAAEPAAEPVAMADDHDPRPAAPRRMRFTFDETT